MASPRHSTGWIYLGLAMAPAAIVVARPTTGEAAGDSVQQIRGLRVRGDALVSSHIIRQAPPPPQNETHTRTHDIDSDGDSDNEGHHTAAPSSTFSTSTIVSLSPTATQLASTALAEQSASKEAKEHWLIAIGSVLFFVVICTICFLLWKWRGGAARRFSRRRRNGGDGLQRFSEKGPAITGPVHNGGWHHRQATSPVSESDRHRSHLFGAPTIVSGSGGDHHDHYPHFPSAMPYPPPPALAPSTVRPERQADWMKLVRRSLLDKAEKRRILVVEGEQTFYPEDELNTTGPKAPQRKTKRESLSLTIQVPNTEGATFPPPAVPDSPEAARENTRYSWITPPTQLQRESIESQPLKFREVDSWVIYQANRTMRNEEEENGTEAWPTPPTPVEFRQHPGVEVKFGSNGRRIESRVLDLRLDARS